MCQERFLVQHRWVCHLLVCLSHLVEVQLLLARLVHPLTRLPSPMDMHLDQWKPHHHLPPLRVLHLPQNRLVLIQ